MKAATVMGMAVILSACASHGTRESNRPETSSQTNNVPPSGSVKQYCLKRFPKPLEIYGASSDYFDPEADLFDQKKHLAYRIRQNASCGPYPSPICIDADDRITLHKWGSKGELRLSHRSSKGVLKARALLDPEGSTTATRWMAGRAVNEDDESLGGDYFVYVLGEDAKCNGYSNSNPPAQKPNTSCKVLHFEYFDRMDTARLPEKPYNNGVVTELAGSCSRPTDIYPQQATEGDGDQGPDRP